MRRHIMSLAMAVIATLFANLAWAGNQEIAQSIAKQLRASNVLADYKINIKYDNGTCWLRGRVSHKDQLLQAIRVARGVEGVDRVINELTVEQPTNSQPAVRPAQFQQPVVRSSRPAAPAPPATNPAPQPAIDLKPSLSDPSVTQTRYRTPGSGPVSQVSAPPVVSQPIPSAPYVQNPGPSLVTPLATPIPNQQVYQQPVPQQYHNPAQVRATSGRRVISTPPRQISYPAQPMPSAHQASYPAAQGAMPIPAHAASMGAVNRPVRYDHPNMPGYAWPSYASYPNYAAVTYPKVYSPTAWPYIGPFYPYPQVPLGWRKVSLEWDDGWWWLDFDDVGWRH